MDTYCSNFEANYSGLPISAGFDDKDSYQRCSQHKSTSLQKEGRYCFVVSVFNLIPLHGTAESLEE